MFRRAAVVAMVVVAGCGAGQDPSLEVEQTTAPPEGTATTAADSLSIDVTLTPEAVVPGPGTEGARGSATVVLHRSRGEVCAQLQAQGTSSVTGAHIHAGRSGESGDVLISLQVPSGDAAAMTGKEGCVAAAPNVLARLRLAPERYYLDVHTDDRPNGALRGQLG